MIITGLLLVLIFIFLSSIHFYWAFGGKWGTDGVYPSKADGSAMSPPSITATLIVAVGLLAFAVFYMVKAGFIPIEIPLWLNKNGLWILTGIFIIRAIGDFRYFGFFKKVKNTKFASNDTKYYSPLCFIISTLTLVLQLNN